MAEEENTQNTSQTQGSSSQSSSNTSNQTSSDDGTQQSIQQQEEDEQKTKDEEDEAEWNPHMGRIMQIKPYKFFNNVSWDKSYDEPTGTGNISMPYSSDNNDYCFSPSDVKYIYKGVCCKFKIRRSCDIKFSATGIEETGLNEDDIFEREHIPTEEQKIQFETDNQENEINEQESSSNNQSDENNEEDIRYSRSSYDDAIYGFISDISYNQDGAELDIKDWGYALERDDIKLKFSGLHSTVFEEVIKSYGLIPDVDFTGLPNELINWSNINNESNDDSESTIIGGESEDINKLAEEICQGKTSDMDKAQAIHSWLTQNVTYPSPGYSCSHYSSASECLQNKDKLNCADTSRLTRALMSAAGLQAEVAHGPHHFWTVITIDGTEYASDATSHQRKWNEVWKNLEYYEKCGDNPSC